MAKRHSRDWKSEPHILVGRQAGRELVTIFILRGPKDLKNEAIRYRILAKSRLILCFYGPGDVALPTITRLVSCTASCFVSRHLTRGVSHGFLFYFQASHSWCLTRLLVLFPGALFLQELISRLEELWQLGHPYGADKQLDNILVVLSHLYNFKVRTRTCNHWSAPSWCENMSE